MKKILFVCTGNICRSSGAEAVLRHYAQQQGVADKIHIESAGTHGYHIGEAPDKRGMRAAKNRGVSMAGMCAQKFEVEHFQQFDKIIAMDQGHMRIIQAMKPEGSGARLSLFMDYCDGFTAKDVPDPYYGDIQGFEDVLNLLEIGCAAILSHIQH